MNVYNYIFIILYGIFMLSKIINGKIVANKIIYRLSQDVKKYILNGQRKPALAVILVGNDISSKIYVNNKQKVCHSIGFISYVYNFPFNIKEEKLISLIKVLNQNKKIDAILIQLPLPSHINKIKILETISPEKDVDGFHPYNMGRLCLRSPKLRPCTSYGILKLLQYYHINTKGLNALIIGASDIVGRPMSLELLLSGCTITIAHRFTKNLKKYVKNAELLVVAIGKSEFIPGKWIRTGAIVIDVGINKSCFSKTITGDIEFKSALKRASFITPVPGGVGPMTIAMLMQNTFSIYKNFLKKNKK